MTTTPTDWRALCAELVKEIEDEYYGTSSHPDCLLCAQALLAQPEPEGPTDEELPPRVTDEELLSLDDLRDAWNAHADAANSWDVLGVDEIIWFTQQQALARWGRPAIEPVLVSERLPGPEDCAPWPEDLDANQWCWLGKNIDGGWEWCQASALDIAAVQLERVLAGGGWTHWLPHHALPVPETQSTRQED